jgi:hypothetical protein
MKVLVGCEYSGVVRRSFRDRGFDAWSCDLLPCDDKSAYHLQCDVLDAIRSQEWDLIILHPPCTALAVSGNAWYGEGMKKHDERVESVKWTFDLFRLACSVSDHVAMENPVGVLPKMAGMKCTQYVQPYQFGHPESKKTGLWLHGLPMLKETKNVKAEFDSLPKNQQQRLHYLPPSKDRWKIRSTTFLGIAEAMADQWGNYIKGFTNENISNVPCIHLGFRQRRCSTGG